MAAGNVAHSFNLLHPSTLRVVDMILKNILDIQEELFVINLIKCLC